MIYTQLSHEDASFLCDQLEHQVVHLENELVHTDRREMQRELAQDVVRLRAIMRRIEELLQDRDDEHALMAHAR